MPRRGRRPRPRKGPVSRASTAPESRRASSTTGRVGSRDADRPPPPRASVGFALDEAHFGRDRILNLRLTLPTGLEATRRAEAWLRERQASIAGDVLVITGRGRGSLDGIPVVRDAIVRLFPTLRRAGVIVDAREHRQGAFIVRLAPLQALVEAPRRLRRTPPRAVIDPHALEGIAEETRALLRQLAVAALRALGLRTPSDEFVSDEMIRQFTTLAAAVPPGADRERALRTVLVRAIDELEG
jgi:hypothetical protein